MDTSAGTWRELLGRYLGTSVVLAGGVALYATNEFLTVSLLPSAVAEIGGHRFYAWVVTLYLVGSVIAATTVSPVLARLGARASFLLGLGVFAAASVVCALASNVQVLIAGRTLQGLAGGLLAGLGYALINATLPQRLWTRGSALVSAMWGVATVVGPAAGGLFAQFGLWRWAFGATAILALLMALLVPVALGGRAVERVVDAPAASASVPWWSLLAVAAAVVAISVAQLPRTVAAMAALLSVAVLLAVAVIAVERRGGAAVLPPSVFGRGPLKWIYLTMAALMATVMVDTYIPLLCQTLGRLSPVAAGFVGATLALGWTISELISASVANARLVGRIIGIAPVVMSSGLLLTAAAQRVDPSPMAVGGWVVGLLIAGFGIGMAWPHLAMRAMSSVDTPAEGSAAAAAINTVQLSSAAFGAGLAGVVVNSHAAVDVAAARSLYVVFAAVAALGAVSAYQATAADRPD